MKHIFIIISIILATFACSKNNGNNMEIKIDRKTILIDVRTKPEFDSGHLENAINIPFDIIDKKISSITKNKNESIVVYCRSGRRSGIAQKTLRKMGYNNVVNGGGYKDLLKEQSKP